MKTEALFLNGVYESVLEGILRAQRKAPPEETFYLQPYKSQAIARFNRGSREEPPTILYASTTTDLATVSYRADIVGWRDKRCMAKGSDEWKLIDASIRKWGYDRGLYDFCDIDPKETTKRMVNLLFIQNLVKLADSFSVSKLLMIKPLSTNRTTSGGWSYVTKR